MSPSLGHHRSVCKHYIRDTNKPSVNTPIAQSEIHKLDNLTCVPRTQRRRREYDGHRKPDTKSHLKEKRKLNIIFVCLTLGTGMYATERYMNV